MIRIYENPLVEKEVDVAGEDLDGYIKFVVDLQKEIITAGGLRHVEGEQLLLTSGSKQSDLWGGGVDIETKSIDFDSMINIRPRQNNPSREVLDPVLRSSIERIIRKYFLSVL